MIPTALFTTVPHAVEYIGKPIYAYKVRTPSQGRCLRFADDEVRLLAHMGLDSDRPVKEPWCKVIDLKTGVMSDWSLGDAGKVFAVDGDLKRAVVGDNVVKAGAKAPVVQEGPMGIIDYERAPDRKLRFTMAGLWYTMAVVGLIVLVLCCLYQVTDSGRRTDAKVDALGGIAGLMGWFGWCVCVIWRRRMDAWFRTIGYLLAFATLFLICLPRRS